MLIYHCQPVMVFLRQLTFKVRCTSLLATTIRTYLESYFKLISETVILLG